MFRYVDIQVLGAKTEQEFLRLAVQITAKDYRDLHDRVSPPQATCDEVVALRESPY